MNFQFLDLESETSNLFASNDVNEQLTLAQRWLEGAYEWFLSRLPNIIAAIVIFAIGWWLIKVICKIFVRAMKKGKADLTVISFLNSIINTVLKVLLILCTLSTVGFDITTLIATISAATVAIGLALKDSLSNVASGTLIILNKKFKIGDYLETEGLQGEVAKIDMMYTTLRTYDNKEIMIPNSRLTSNNITNYFVRDERRVDIVVPIAYSEDIDKARRVIFDLMDNHPKVLHEHNNKVAVKTLNESSVDLRIWIWCRSEDYWIVLDEMQEGIKKTLDKHHIAIPFNQLDVHLIDDKENTK